MTAPTAEDLEAVRLLLGNTKTRVFSIPSSTGSSYYSVEERIDTKNGGTYFFCPCPGWKFAMGKGKVCRHAEQARINAERMDAQ